MLRNDHQIIDPENIIPSRDPAQAAARIEREITNGVIRDRIDLDVALGSWEYRFLTDETRAALHNRFPKDVE